MGTAGPFFQKRPPRHSPPISVERRQGRTLSPDATAPQRVYWCVVPPAPLTKAAYADRLGVSPSAVSKLIARHKLYPPALLDDGKIDPAIADRQLHAALNATASCAARQRRPRSRVPALVDVNGARAAAREAASKEAREAQ